MIWIGLCPHSHLRCRRFVLPAVLDGVIIPAEREQDIKNATKRPIPDYFDLSREAKDAGCDTFIASDQTAWNDSSTILHIGFQCFGNICGEYDTTEPCSRLGSISGSSSKCLTFSDGNTKLLEKIMLGEAIGRDVVLHNFHPNLFDAAALILPNDEFDTRVLGHLRISQILQPSSSLLALCKSVLAVRLVFPSPQDSNFNLLFGVLR